MAIKTWLRSSVLSFWNHPHSETWWRQHHNVMFSINRLRNGSVEHWWYKIWFKHYCSVARRAKPSPLLWIISMFFVQCRSQNTARVKTPAIKQMSLTRLQLLWERSWSNKTVYIRNWRKLQFSDCQKTFWTLPTAVPHLYIQYTHTGIYTYRCWS